MLIWYRFWKAPNLKNRAPVSTGAQFLKNRRFPKTCEKTSIWGPFWEAKIDDFRTFFDVFSKKNLECKLGRQKIEKNGSETLSTALLGSLRRSVRPWGEGKRMGGRQLGRHLGMNPWHCNLGYAFKECILRNLAASILHARPALREAADVRCTPRRTEREEGTALGSASVTATASIKATW